MKSKDTSQDHQGYAKKTDTSQPDVDYEEDVAEPTITRATTPKTTKKSDLDEPIVVDENSSSAIEDDDSAGTDNDNVVVNMQHYWNHPGNRLTHSHSYSRHR